MKQQTNQTCGPEAFAVGLGCFSVGLGLAELVAPHAIARLIGIRASERNASVLRAFGAREVATGVAILTEPDRAAWMWGRVGGDVVDFLSLLQADKTHPSRTAVATAAVLGVAALDAGTARQLSRTARGRAEVQIAEAATVNATIEEVFAFWRRFENFPRFMRHIESVDVAGRRSHWRAAGPAGVRVEWDAELIEDVENERISWRTVDGSQIEHHGSVRFGHAPGSRGTEVHVHLHYSPPAGAVGATLAWLLGSDPESQLREDLRRVKQILETGEVLISDGPALWRPAQPADRPETVKSLAGVQS